MTNYILEAKNITYKYPGSSIALDNISVGIEKGKKTVFLGGNGAGKSTLFLHLNGILKPNKGCITFNKEPVKYNKNCLKKLRKSVGIVFQDPDTQLFSSSVFQEVSFGPLNLGLSEEKTQELVEMALEATGTIDISDKPTHFLSYGQKKRVTIASIIAMEPDVIIFDEPTNYLDPKHKNQIMDFISELNKKGTTIILSTHDVDLAYSWADNIIVMNEGKIMKKGSASEIFLDEDLLKASSLTAPTLVDLYKELINKNIIPKSAPLPKNKDELFALINSSEKIGS